MLLEFCLSTGLGSSKSKLSERLAQMIPEKTDLPLIRSFSTSSKATTTPLLVRSQQSAEESSRLIHSLSLHPQRGDESAMH